MSTSASSSVPRFIAKSGVDEMSLAELPIFYIGLNSPSSRTSVTYEAVLSENENPYKRRVTIKSGEHGLPVERDGDVLLALFLIAYQSQQSLDTPRAQFSRGELLELLGWPNQGQSYRRLEQSLDRWIQTHFKFDNWVDPDTGKRGKKAFNILAGYELYDGRSRVDQKSLPLSYVEFTKDFWTVFQRRWFRDFNFEIYRSLSSPVAKQAFRFLSKRLYKAKSIDLDLVNFACGHLGYSRNNAPSRLKQRLKPVLGELADVGVIEPDDDQERYKKQRPGVYRIRLRRSDQMDKITQVEHPLVAELTACGVSPKVAERLVLDASIPKETIRQKIEYLEWLQACQPENAPEKPGGWLHKAIVDDFTPPKEFVTKAQREEQERLLKAKQRERELLLKEKEQSERKREKEKERLRQEERRRIEGFYTSLTAENRRALVEDAFSSQAEFIVQRARPHASQNDPPLGVCWWFDNLVEMEIKKRLEADAI